MLIKFPVISKAFPTYKYWVKQEQFVRAMFINPAKNIIAGLKWIIIASLILILILGTCVYLLFKAWLAEKRASVIKDDFINNITHELKTPIATIAAAVEAMQSFDVLDNKEKTTRYLKHAYTQTEKLNSLVNKVLNISFYSQHNAAINKESIIVTEILNSLNQSLLVANSNKNLEFKIINKLKNDELKADSSLFNEAMINILQNAINYSNYKITITITINQIDNFIQITIADNGWGINKNDIPFLYDKFFRAASKNHAVKGHGLGLYHVKQIMLMHNGSINITSKINIGTTIILKFPIL